MKNEITKLILTHDFEYGLKAKNLPIQSKIAEIVLIKVMYLPGEINVTG